MDKGLLFQSIALVLLILSFGFGVWGSKISEKNIFRMVAANFSNDLISLEEEIKNVQLIKSKIAMTKPQQVPPNAETKLNFDRLIYDTQDGFWQEGRPGFCSRSGVYDLSLRVHVEGVENETSVLLIIESSNERFQRKYSLSHESPALSVKKSFEIDRGDTVIISLKHQRTTGLLISSDDDKTYLEIEEIGPDS